MADDALKRLLDVFQKVEDAQFAPLLRLVERYVFMYGIPGPWFPPGLGATHPAMETEMYDLGNVEDPLTLPLPPTRTSDWGTKERHVEWVLHNFSKGMLAYLYKIVRDAHGYEFRKETEWGINKLIDAEKHPEKKP